MLTSNALFYLMPLVQLKKRNRLIRKKAYVLLFDAFNRCSLDHLKKKCVTFTIKKSFDFLRKKTRRNTPHLNSQRYKVYSGNRLFWHYHFWLPFVYKSVSQSSFNLSYSGDKRLLSEVLRKWSWFHGHNEHFLKYLG